VETLDRLDVALLAARHWPRRPRHRRMFTQMLTSPIELATVRLLRAIERSGGEDPTVGEIASDLGIDPSTASRLIDRAETLGVVKRQPCEEDGRQMRVGLSPSGHETLVAVAEARRAVLAEVTQGWNYEDLRRLASLLEKLGASFDRFEAAE
jgi:DNA-binding MarR family transcriptional regulator